MSNAILILILVVMLQCSVVAQNGGNGGGNQGGGGGNQGGGVGGIRIDTAGLVQQAILRPASLRDQRIELLRAAKNLPAELNRSSALRKVSLRELDREAGRLLQNGQPIPDEMTALAGLTRIDMICFANEGRDVIIAGPAEGFARQRDGRVVGIDSGRPVLCLDDLLVAIRSVNDRVSVGCSFDPDPGRLVKTQQMLRQNTTANNLADAERGFKETGDVLGNWSVRVLGVPEDSRMAVAMVEADFVLKRLTTGAEKSGVRGFRSHLAMMKPGEDSLRRWWFSPLYDSIERNEDSTVFQLAGPRLQVSAQEELVDAAGNRSDAPVTHVSLEDYAQQFTTRIPALVQKHQALAHLQNLVDLLFATALIRNGQSTGSVAWTAGVLADTQRLPTESWSVPRETPSVVTVRSAGLRTVIGLIAGGVVITPERLLSQIRQSDNAHQLQEFASQESAGRWWWD